MSKMLEQALRADLALAGVENDLLQQAQLLYQLGFTPGNLSSSQMAAVTERIRTASDYQAARASVKKFLEGQLTKLEAKAERSGKATSWASTVAGGGETLGQTLIRWTEAEIYLRKNIPEDLNHLAALQYFWNRFYGLYRYQAEMAQPMTLQS